MAKTKTIRLPISVKIDGVYRPPGFEVELPAEDADRLIAAHGEFDDRGAGGAPGIDPANTNMRTVDAASIAMLNEQGKIENPERFQTGSKVGGASTQAPEKVKTAETITDDELGDMKKDELVSFAEANQIEVGQDDLKPVLLEKIKAEVAKRRAAAK